MKKRRMLFQTSHAQKKDLTDTTVNNTNLDFDSAFNTAGGAAQDFNQNLIKKVLIINEA